MARYTGPKNKLSRRAGQDLGLKTNAGKTSRRLNIPPGQHGRKGFSKQSEYGIQLREKQKVKWVYGIMEKQFRRYFTQATKNPAATGAELLRILETRLDNAVFRLGFAPTRAAARQMVVHGHMKVNGQKIDRPSYRLKVNDTVALSDKGSKIPVVAELLTDKNKNIPAWLNRQANQGKMVRLPERTDIDADINENLVVEFYSRS